MLNNTISLSDKRLTRREKHILRMIALRLQAIGPRLDDGPRPELPPGYRETIDRAFGRYGENSEMLS
jgi:hypothetical protein